MENLHRNYKSKEEMQALMEKRFDYLPKKDGKEFVKVPNKELQRLRIDAYP